MRGFTVAQGIVLGIVVVVVATAAVLLAKTVTAAQRINDKAANIARTGTGINNATDAVIQLTRTNRAASSILESASPLEEKLDGVVREARAINALAGSINSTAGDINGSAVTINTTAGDINATAGTINQSATSINGDAQSINSSAGRINGTAGEINATAGEINGTARGINSEAGDIVTVAREIDNDVNLINRNLEVTLGTATRIKEDTANILGQAEEALDTGGCIDRKLYGRAGDNGDCRAARSASDRDARRVPRLRSQEELERLLRRRGRSAPRSRGRQDGRAESERPDPRGRDNEPEPTSPDTEEAPVPGGGATDELLDQLFDELR
jgi:uncharacterized protein YoxC